MRWMLAHYDAIFIAGILISVTGIAMWSIPTAVFLTGVSVTGLAVMIAIRRDRYELLLRKREAREKQEQMRGDNDRSNTA